MFTLVVKNLGHSRQEYGGGLGSSEQQVHGIEGSTLMAGSVCPLGQRGEPRKYDIVFYYGRFY